MTLPLHRSVQINNPECQGGGAFFWNPGRDLLEIHFQRSLGAVANLLNPGIVAESQLFKEKSEDISIYCYLLVERGIDSMT